MFRELLVRKLAGVAELSGAQLAALEEHHNLLVRWSRKLNLTAIEGVEDAVERHYCEGVFLAVHLPSGHLSVADMGSGAGFPGIPVAIMRPDCEVTLIESHRRKAVFLREATRLLLNLRVLPERAEQVRERFDRVIARAVSYQDLAAVLKYIAPAADLLTGGEGPPGSLRFRWSERVRLPWGANRYLWSGVRVDTETDSVPGGTVSRETK